MYKFIVSIVIICFTSASAKQVGIASIYSVETNGGKHTASGKPLCDSAYTAAHKTLPLGSLAEVKCNRSGKSVVVKITDRGPYIKGRIIDLTPKAAQAIGLTWKKGLASVTVAPIAKTVTPPTPKKEEKPKEEAKPKPEAIKVTPAPGAPFVEKSTISVQLLIYMMAISMVTQVLTTIWICVKLRK